MAVFYNLYSAFRFLIKIRPSSVHFSRDRLVNPPFTYDCFILILIFKPSLLGIHSVSVQWKIWILCLLVDYSTICIWFWYYYYYYYFSLFTCFEINDIEHHLNVLIVFSSFLAEWMNLKRKLFLFAVRDLDSWLIRIIEFWWSLIFSIPTLVVWRITYTICHNAC